MVFDDFDCWFLANVFASSLGCGGGQRVPLSVSAFDGNAAESWPIEALAAASDDDADACVVRRRRALSVGRLLTADRRRARPTRATVVGGASVCLVAARCAGCACARRACVAIIF